MTLTLASQAQSEDSLLETALDNLLQQVSLFPQEKIHLQTDKPYYISGEKMFFRAFLLNATSHQPEEISRYVYVELINPLDSIVERLQIKGEDKLYAGALTLPEDLPQGDYKIRSYTRWMENQGEESFSTRYVHIADPQITTIETETSFQFLNEKQVEVSIRFLDAKTKNPILPKSIALRLNKEKIQSPKPDNEGWARVQFNLSEDTEKRILFAELDFERKVLKQYIRIPYPENKFSVSFYPEGGHILADQASTVAFKALQSDGNVADITGELFDSADNKLFEFETVHEGMGSFTFTPQQGKQYYAVCTNGSQIFRLSLPDVKTDAYSLNALWQKDKLRIKVNKPISIADKKMYLVIHSRGNALYAQEWDNSKEELVFSQKDFPSGVSHLLLLTENFQPLSERLIFTFHEKDWLQPSIQTHKNTYQTRDLVKMDVLLEAEGSLAVSITDDKDVKIDTTSTILTEILLTSELRGQISRPWYYFQTKNNKAIAAADLLMMTHGWTRYDIPATLQGNLRLPEIPNEQSQSLSGIVKGGLLSKTYEGALVSLFSMEHGYYNILETDQNGQFYFDNFEFPNHTTFFVQAKNKRGKNVVELYLDPIHFPPSTDFRFIPKVTQIEEESMFLDYVAKANQKYVYENGMRMINLDEVTVYGSRINREDRVPYPQLSRVITGEKLATFGDMLNLISSLGFQVRTGVQMENGDLVDVMVIRGKLVPISEELKILHPSDLEAIGVKETPFGKIIIPILKPFDKRMEKPKYNIAIVTPLGYQSPVEFYSPKYDTPEAKNNTIPDLRSTIYWNPDVIVNSKGEAEIDFYSADYSTTYSIVIEGVTPNGKLIYYHGKSAIIVR